MKNNRVKSTEVIEDESKKERGTVPDKIKSMQNSNSSIKPGFWQSAGKNPFWINVVDNQVFWLGMNQK